MKALTKKTVVRHEQVIVFTRYPEPGKTKTRLIPALGPCGAAELQRKMTEHLLRTVNELAGQRSISLEVRFEGGTLDEMKRWLESEVSCRHQGEGDLGQRLQRAFTEAFAGGFQRVVVVGADCPALSAETISRAFELLKTAALVLGPANDGGYYLVGLNRPAPEIFTNIPWGTERVLEKTLVCARKLDMSPALLAPLSDVDRPEDLNDLHHHTCAE